MPQNFSSNFLQGFGQMFPRTFDTSYRHGLKKQDDETKKQEALMYQKGQQDIFGQLVDSSISRNKATELVGQADPKTLQRVNFVKGLLEKPDSFTNFKFDREEGIYGYSKKENKFSLVQAGNPFFTPKEEKPVYEGLGYVGQKQVKRKIFKNADGTQRAEDVYTGFFKEKVKGKEVEKLDLSFYKKNLSLYEAKKANQITKIGVLNKLPADDPTVFGKKEEINKDFDVMEQELAMDLTPEAQGEINKYYTKIKQKIGGDIPQNFEYKNGKQLKQAFLEGVTKKYLAKTLDGDLSYVKDYEKMSPEQQLELQEEMNRQIFRSLKIWADLKFDRL